MLNTLQNKVDKEIDKLLAQGHIQKLEECSDEYFFLSDRHHREKG